MDRGPWWTTIHGVAELDTTEQLTCTHTYCIMASANSDSFYFFLSCLVSVTRTSNTYYCAWKWKNGHPCLISDLRRNVFIFSLLSVILFVGLSHMVFVILWLCSIYTNFVEDLFFCQNCWPLSNTFYVPVERIIWFFSLIFFFFLGLKYS